MTDVVANRVGFYGGRIREVGERFTLASPADKGGWMTLVDEAEGIPRVHERHSSPTRAEVGPNEAMAYAEAGQLTTALNMQLKDAYSQIANLTAEVARLEAALADKDAVGKVDAKSAAAAAGRARVAQEKADEADKAAEKVEADADFRASEDPEAIEAKADADEAKEEAEEKAEDKEADEGPRPTRRRRG